MLTGVLLDGDVFSNVEVSNGKLVNDGDRIIAAGLAFPGLQENLGIDSEKLEIPNYVEITADAKNFKLTNTVTIAANELFNNIDSSKFDDIDSLKSSMTELSDSMTALTDGSSALYDGLCTLLEKSDELAAGIDALAEGAAQLRQVRKAQLRARKVFAAVRMRLRQDLRKSIPAAQALTTARNRFSIRCLPMQMHSLRQQGLISPR